ncbi:MAG: hypothetical protein A49_25620 [Methyloceanibacter sp.]|nr:MAG: hypothetical protein A49_25620 [Methyloceanibacter sp.]
MARSAPAGSLSGKRSLENPDVLRPSPPPQPETNASPAQSAPTLTASRHIRLSPRLTSRRPSLDMPGVRA